MEAAHTTDIPCDHLLKSCSNDKNCLSKHKDCHCQNKYLQDKYIFILVPRNLHQPECEEALRKQVTYIKADVAAKGTAFWWHES